MKKLISLFLVVLFLCAGVSNSNSQQPKPQPNLSKTELKINPKIEAIQGYDLKSIATTDTGLSDKKSGTILQSNNNNSKKSTTIKAMWDILQRKENENTQILMQSVTGWVNSIAELRSFDAKVGDIVATKGYYEINDGGGAFYNIRARIGDTNDGGSIIILNNGNVAELITDGTINVKQFGAIGNANYTNYDDGKLYENVSTEGATVASYYDNIGKKWYVSALFTTEGIYEHLGKHYASYNSGTGTYSDEAPYYDNIGKKWYVSAAYSNVANAYVDGVWYCGATFSTEATDDTTTIQNAINKGRIIFFPKGNYACVNLFLTDSDKTILGSNATLRRNSGAGARVNILGVYFCDNIIVSGLSFDGRNRVYGIDQFHHNLAVYGCSNIIIDNVVSKYAYGDGLYVSGRHPIELTNRAMRNLTLRNCQFLYSCRNGMSVIECDGLVAENCRFDYTGRSDGGGHAPMAGVDLEPNYDTEYVQNITFLNCHFSHNSGSGVACKKNTTTNVKIAGCVFEDDYIYGVDCCRNSVTSIEKCVFSEINLAEQDRAAATRAAINQTGNNGTVKVSNVVIKNCGGDGIKSNSKIIIENVDIDSVGYRGLNINNTAVVKNVKILNTFFYRNTKLAYSASVYISGENVTLENIEITNDARVKSPAAVYGLKLINTARNNISLKGVCLNGIFDTPIENINRASIIVNVYLNGLGFKNMQ